MSDILQSTQRLELIELVHRLNERHAQSSAQTVLSDALTEQFTGQTAVVSSFGAESAVLLQLVSDIDRSVPIIFLNSLKHFPETTAYVDELAGFLNLTDVRVIEPSPVSLSVEDPHGDLHARDPDRCCYLRKTLPMISALSGFKAWVTGRKRFQTSERATLDYFEHQEAWIKINPLRSWTAAQIADFMTEHSLPAHPLLSRGYRSIGCAPCTHAVADGADPRSGRWKDHGKTECGIHFVNGRVVRGAR